MFGRDCSPVSCEPSSLWPPPDLEPNPDIAGIGVLTGFVGTSYFAFIILVLNYLISYETTGNRSDDTEDHTTTLNLIDDLFLNHSRYMARRMFPRLLLPFDAIQRQFIDTIMNICDVQIVTGLGILAGGVASLDCQLSAYHWAIIVRLAWFSSVTHLAGISSLREHLRSNSWERTFRLILMFALLGCLIVSMLPTGLFNWAASMKQGGSRYFLNSYMDDPEGLKALKAYNEAIWSPASRGSPAWCFFDLESARKIWSYRQAQACKTFLEPAFDHLIDDPYYGKDDISCEDLKMNDLLATEPSDPFQTTGMQSTIFSIILLALGFISRSARAFPVIPGFINDRVRAPLGKGLRILSEALRFQLESLSVRAVPLRGVPVFFLILSLRLVSASHLALRFYLEFFLSRFAEIGGHFFLLLWGTWNIIGTRHDIPSHVQEIENQWSFGQILPAALLAAPLLSMILQIVSLGKACEQRQPREYAVASMQSSEPVWEITVRRAQGLKGALSHVQSTDRADQTGAQPAIVVSIKAILCNFIPGTIAIAGVMSLVITRMGNTGIQANPINWLKGSFLFHVFVQQPVGSVLYHMAVLTVLDRQGENPIPWGKIVGINWYGALIQVTSLAFLRTDIGGLIYGGFMTFSLTIILLIDLPIWVAASMKMQKEGRTQDVPRIT